MLFAYSQKNFHVGANVGVASENAEREIFNRVAQ